MARFFGKVGYAIPTKTAAGVVTEEIVERSYKGYVTRNMRQLSNGAGLNDDINISNEIDILADAFAYQNFHAIRYVEYMGACWKVQSVEVERPRLMLSLGGVYNGQRPARSS